MKQMITYAILLIMAASCSNVTFTEKEEFEWGTIHPSIELILKDGVYMPKNAPVENYHFTRYFNDEWVLSKIYTVASSGRLTETEFSYVDDEPHPLFAVKDEGKVRQYIESSGGTPRSFKDGTYSYDETTGVLIFKDIIETHPEFRVIQINSSRLSGTFRDESNNSDDSVLTLYVYTHASYTVLELDIAFGASD